MELSDTLKKVVKATYIFCPFFADILTEICPNKGSIKVFLNQIRFEVFELFANNKTLAYIIKSLTITFVKD